MKMYIDVTAPLVTSDRFITTQYIITFDLLNALIFCLIVTCQRVINQLHIKKKFSPYAFQAFLKHVGQFLTR